jgi:hypothetical protein
VVKGLRSATLEDHFALNRTWFRVSLEAKKILPPTSNLQPIAFQIKFCLFSIDKTTFIPPFVGKWWSVGYNEFRLKIGKEVLSANEDFFGNPS